MTTTTDTSAVVKPVKKDRTLLFIGGLLLILGALFVGRILLNPAPLTMPGDPPAVPALQMSVGRAMQAHNDAAVACGGEVNKKCMRKMRDAAIADANTSAAQAKNDATRKFYQMYAESLNNAFE